MLLLQRPARRIAGRPGYWSWLRVALVVVAVAHRRLGPSSSATTSTADRALPSSGDATSIRVFDDDRIIVNLTLWESLETLWAFTYASRHLDMLRRRREWFHRMAAAHLALWWVPAGHIPTVAEAVARLEALGRNGPSPEAFTLREPFPAPDAPTVLTGTGHDGH